MTVTAPAGAVEAGGTVRLAGRDVHWRFGWADDARSEPSRVAREWLEELVARYDLFRWQGIERDGAWSKPRFIGAPDADFSISHSDRGVLIAVAEGPGIGADIEVAPYRAFTAGPLLRRMCAPAEHARLSAMAPAERRRHAVALWTAKEAAVKATGRGLADDFRTFAIEPAPLPPDVRASAHIAVATGTSVVVRALDVFTARHDSEPSPDLSVRLAR